jgi:hypothetical protein
MPVDHFVGRQDDISRLVAVLTGEERAGGKLTVQSIEGPGGIGKTCLFDHVLRTTDLGRRNYLTLKIDGTVDGNNPSAKSLVRSIARLVASAEADAIRDRPAGFYFPDVGRVTKAIDQIRDEAAAEFRKRSPDCEEGRAALLRFLDLAVEAGKGVNDAIPITKKYVNVRELEKSKKLLEEMVPTLVSLQQEGAGFLERRTGWFSGARVLRNSIRDNACKTLADALVSDLSAILKRYRPADKGKATHSKVAGIDRLLLIFDDYEKLQETLDEFLTVHLLRSLRSANFESTVILLVRDRLEATHPEWDQHVRPNLIKRIALTPLSRVEMDEMVESFGVRALAEKDRAWRDTEGYPFYVQLWVEEAEAGGRSALMLKRFHDRITRWMSDSQRRWLEHVLFLDAVNIRSLRGMLGSATEAEDAFRWFENDGSVRDIAAQSFRVREYLRSRLVDYLRVCDPDRCEGLEARSRSIGELKNQSNQG